MAAADQFTIEIRGGGGHGAAPHQTTDPILAASHVVQALQSIVSRRTDPVEPVVVSVCTINGGNSFNVIPDTVTMNGTVRTLNPLIQKEMPEMIRDVLKGVTSYFGAEFRFDYKWGYPALVNNRQALEIVRMAGNDIVGAHRVMTLNVPSMGAEDFACFTGRVPGAYFLLGVKGSGKEIFPWHNPRFDIDESALATGAAMLAACVVHAQKSNTTEKRL